PLPDERMPALEAHFSTEYEQVVRKMAQQIVKLEAGNRALHQLSRPNRTEPYEVLVTDYSQANKQLDASVTAITDYLASLVAALKDKKRKLFETQSLEVAVPDVHQSVIDGINAIVRRHNQTCADFEGHVRTAREKLEADSVASSLD